jgi:hypothetical protein
LKKKALMLGVDGVPSKVLSMGNSVVMSGMSKGVRGPHI